MAIQGFQVYFQTPDIGFFMPNFDFLTAERIHQAATATLEGGLVVTGFVQGGFAISDILNNRTLPAIAHGGTSVLCFWSYSAIGEFKEKIAQLETMKAQLETFRATNDELKESIARFHHLFESFTSNSTDLTQINGQIRESVDRLEAVARNQSLSVVQSLVTQIKDLFAEDRGKMLVESKKELEEVTKSLVAAKEQLVNTSQSIERQMSALTLQYNATETKRSQLEFLTGLVPRALNIAQHPSIYDSLTDEDKQRIEAIRQFYERNIPLLGNLPAN